MAVWSLIKRWLLCIKRWLFSALTIDFALIIALTLFMGWMAAHFFIGNHTLYHDNYQFYGQWRDQLDSLNSNGEIEWWAPHYQSGTAAYYYAALGDLNCTSPQFAIIGFIVWLLGRIGYSYNSYLVPFVIHFAFIDPLLATLGVYAVARQLFTNRAVVRYAIIMAAFSPGVALNLSDVGFLEPTAYGLFFIAAFLYFLRRPSSLSSLFVGLSLCVLAVCLNYTFIVVNLVFLPVCIAVITFVPRKLWRRVLWALWVVPWWQHLALAVCFALCLVPNLLIHSQGRDIVRTRTGEGEYKLDDLFVGNPLEALTVSVPDFGYEWRREPYWKRNELTLGQESVMLTRMGQGYEGLACIPLTVLALAFARRRVRRQLMILMLVFFGIVVLVIYSPIWTFVLWLSATLRANNHFSDLVFRGFGYLILILASSIGLQVLLGSRDPRIWRAAKWLFVVSSLVSLVLFYSMAKDQMLGMPSFGLFMLLSLLIWCAINELQPIGDRRRKRRPALLLAVVALDLSTFMFIHINNTSLGGHRLITDKPLENSVGFASDSNDYANTLMSFRSYNDLKKNGFNNAEVPMTILCDRAHVSGDISHEIAKLQGMLVGDEPMSIALDKEDADEQEFAPFIAVPSNKPSPRQPGDSVDMKWKRYNRYSGTVVCKQPSLLFIRDGYSRYWAATVDGERVPVARALFNFKAIPLPAGSLKVELVFALLWVAMTLSVAYLVLISLCVTCCCLFVLCFLRKRRAVVATPSQIAVDAPENSA